METSNRRTIWDYLFLIFWAIAITAAINEFGGDFAAAAFLFGGFLGFLVGAWRTNLKYITD